MAEQEKSLEEIDHESYAHDIQLPTIHIILFFFASVQLKLSTSLTWEPGYLKSTVIQEFAR